MARLKLAPAARQDLLEIHDYIAQDAPGRAARFIEELEAKFPLLAEHPGIGTLRDDLAPDIRSFPVGNYVLFYRPAPDGVEIVRVLHGARDIPSILGAV